MKQVLEIARMTFLEARMRKVLWAGLLLSIAYLGVFAAGFHFMYRDVSRAFGGNSARMAEPVNFFVMAGVYGVNFLVAMLAALTSVDTIAGEISSGTIHSVVTKPLRRWQVIVGKWAGLAGILAVFTILMCTAVMFIAWLNSHQLPPNPVGGVALIILGGLVVLSVSILGGTRLTTLANGVVVFMLYGLAFVAGWIEQIGSFLRSEAAVNTGILVSLLMPSEAMWKRAAYLMQPPFLRELGLTATPFGAASAPSPAMVVYTMFYVVVLLAIAVRWFRRRDL